MSMCKKKTVEIMLPVIRLSIWPNLIGLWSHKSFC